MLSDESYRELLRYRRGSIHVGENGLSQREKHLKEQKYIEAAERRRKDDSVDEIEIITLSYKITPLGEAALSEFEKVRDEKAEDKSSKRFEHIFQVLLVFLGAAIGLVVEHFSGIVGFIVSLFQP